MTKFKKLLTKNIAIGAALAVLSIPGPAMAATTIVSSANPAPTPLGAVLAGTTYNVSATGISNLFAGFNNGAGLTFTPDGQPTYPFPTPYSGFPSDSDPSQPSRPNCVAGAGILCGALVGTFSANPGPSDYFILGASSNITPVVSGILYGLVNDVPGGYGDNTVSGFNVNLAAVSAPVSAVPEPATWAMMLVGFGAVGAAMRRRRKQNVRVRFAQA